MSTCANLCKAQQAKNDEFYTAMEMIEAEIPYYSEALKGKTVFCNCDRPSKSNFVKYFLSNFERLGLKRLIAVSYPYGEYLDTSKPDASRLKGDGDFQSEESRELLYQSDVVITNPPFSKIRPYMAQLFEWGGRFLILAHITTVSTSKPIACHFFDNSMWLGRNLRRSAHRNFVLPSGELVHVNARWLTNLGKPYYPEPLELVEEYSPDVNPNYHDRPDAIECKWSRKIPRGYYGIIGVPITFLDHYNPEQFEILETVKPLLEKEGRIVECFQRLFIMRRHSSDSVHN